MDRNDQNKQKHVGIITSNTAHFNHVVRVLQDMNPDVMFHHVFDFSCCRNINFDKLVAYDSDRWSMQLDHDFLYIRQRYKTIMKEEIEFVDEVREPFVIFRKPRAELINPIKELMPNIYINGSVFIGKAEEVILPHLRAKAKELSTDPIKRFEQLVSMWNGFQNAPISRENIRKLQEIKELAEETLTDFPELFKGQKHRAYDYHRELLDLKIDANLSFPSI